MELKQDEPQSSIIRTQLNVSDLARSAMLTRACYILGTSAVFLATMNCGVAQAAWPSDPTANVPLCTAVQDQGSPAIVSDGAGGAIVTWQDSRFGNGWEVFAQRVNAAGTPLWTTGGVALCTAAGNQSSPAIASDGAGGAVIAWVDDRSGATDLYAQRVDGAGVPQWNAGGVALCTAAQFQNDVQIVPDGAGGALLAWVDDRNNNPDIYAQRINAAGTALWTANGVALCIAANSQLAPRIVPDGSGGAFVTWSDLRGGLYYGVFAQRVNAAGAPQWTADGEDLCAPGLHESDPAIASDGAGGVIIAWRDYRAGGPDADIYAQRVNVVGALQWTVNGVALCTAPLDQSGLVITTDGANGAIVTWVDHRSGASDDIYSQRVSATGASQWTTNGVPLCTAADSQLNPTATSDGAGGAIVSWKDFRSGAGADVYTQRVTASGAPQWLNDGVAVCTAVDYQVAPVIAPAGAGGAIVAWEDRRSGTNADIYAQNVNANGTLGGTVVSVPPLSIPASFALRSVQPNPSFGDLRASFSLPDGTPATLELYDLTGRRIESEPVGELGPGAHVASLPPRVPALSPGVYWLSLTQGSRHAFSRIAIVR